MSFLARLDELNLLSINSYEKYMVIARTVMKLVKTQVPSKHTLTILATASVTARFSVAEAISR